MCTVATLYMVWDITSSIESFGAMSFGIECYLGIEREGFTGEIKQNWQDFIVTEIDKEGQMVELCSYDIPPTSQEKQHCCIVTPQEECEVGNKRKNERQCLDTPLTAKISGSEQTRESALTELAKILDSAKLKELTDFACCTENTRGSSRKLCLGSKTTKEERVALHMNVRLAFPHLKTETVSIAGQQGNSSEIYTGSDPAYWEFSDLLSDKRQVDRLLCFAHWEDKKVPATLDLTVSTNKEQRTKIHRLLSKHFGSFLESKTFSNSTKMAVDAQSCIQIRMRAKRTKQPHNKPTSMSSRQVQDEIYTGFVMCKRYVETLEAIQRLSSCLNVQPSAFSYAGIKDKKALTKQYMVVRGISPEQMHAVQGHPSLEGIEFGNYRRGMSPVRLGELSGNHFMILIRNIKCHHNHRIKENIEECQQAIEDAVSSLSMTGFLNYFGPQRFGLDDKEVNACDVGLAMLRGDMMQAVKLLLTPLEQEQDNPTDAAKRYYFETGDVQGSLKRMPSYKVRETLVLKALHRHGTDMEGCRRALLNIPYTMRLLYVHSYCSLVWNQMASYRIQQYCRSAAVQGDLIRSKPYSAHAHVNEGAAISEDLSGSAEEQEQNGGMAQSRTRDHVRCLSAQDETTKCTIQDVVLPLPGYSIKYPENTVGLKYKERLEADGLTVKSFRLRSLGINLPGAYRKLVAMPSGLSWSWVSAEHAQMVHQGDEVGKRAKLRTNEHDDKSEQHLDVPDAVESLSEVKREWDHSIPDNVHISFSLGPSCYATVFLRELMHN